MLRETFRKVLGPDSREWIPLYGFPVLLRNTLKSRNTEQSGFPGYISRVVYQSLVGGGTAYGLVIAVGSLL